MTEEHTRMFELKLDEEQLRVISKTLVFAETYPTGFTKEERKFIESAGFDMMKMWAEGRKKDKRAPPEEAE